MAEQARAIRAVVVDPQAPGRLVLQSVAPPRPAPSEALVRVAAISLNRGEVRQAMSAEAGWRPGWDLAGTVETAAADGSGPPAGARVVGLLRAGAWAERVAAPTHALAELPPGLSFADAATLPVAGLTALLALERGGGLVGRSVLITGASGGVGLFAVQLARLAGARVVGSVRQETHLATVRAAGADEAVAGEDLAGASALGPYWLILDSVGGQVLGQALGMLQRGGTCVSFGVSAASDVTFDVRRFYRTGRAALYGFFLFDELGQEPAAVGLDRLAHLVAGGRLRTSIEVEADWSEVGAVAQRLLERRFPGKAVLHLGS